MTTAFSPIYPRHIGPDEHADFAEYLCCKSRLLSMCRIGLVNLNDGHFKEIVKDASCRLYTYRVKEDAVDDEGDFLTLKRPVCVPAGFCGHGVLMSQEHGHGCPSGNSRPVQRQCPGSPCAYAPSWDFQKIGLSTPWSTYVSMDVWKSSTPSSRCTVLVDLIAPILGKHGEPSYHPAPVSS